MSDALEASAFSDLPDGTVTFLFTDIEGSTQLLARLRDQYAALRDDHHRILRQAFANWGGLEIETEGDSFFVAFPRATDAVNAVVEAQRAITTHSWLGGERVFVRMGLHTGEPWKSQGGYIGMAVHRAARITSAGHGGQVLLSETAAALVKGELPEGVELLDLGRHQLKDMPYPEHICQLIIPGLPSEFPKLNSLGVLPVEIPAVMGPAKLPAYLDSGLEKVPPATFVGRERELLRLNGYLDEAIAGHGGIAFVIGGPGRGKTALMEAFSRQVLHEKPDLIVASGNCNAFIGVGDPYLPFYEIMATLTSDVEAKVLSGNITREHAVRLWNAFPLVIEALLNHGPDVIHTLLLAPALQSRAEVALPIDSHLLHRLRENFESQRQHFDGIEQSYLFQQVTNVLHALAENKPLLLVLDDLQWADSASINLLFHIGRRLKGSRVLIVGAYRQVDIALGRRGERHPLEMVLAEFKRMYGDIWMDLGKVDENDGRRFIELYLDTEPNQLDMDFRETLYKHTTGHTLFTIELLRTFQERRDLVKNEAGDWVSTPALDWSRTPARVEGVIEERIGRLDSGLRQILSVGSVQGEEFTLQVIAKVLGSDERQLLERVNRELDSQHRLVKGITARWLRGRQLHTYRFRHSMFQQYLYDQLGAAERPWLHGEIAAALESLFGAGASQIIPSLAYHYKLAGNLAKAHQFLYEAGCLARNRYANQEAVDYFSQALALIGEDELEPRYKLLLERECVHALMGNREAWSQDLAMLESLAGLLGEVKFQAEAALRNAKYAGAAGDNPKAIRAAEHSARLASEAGLIGLAAMSHKEWGRALAFSGELGEAGMHLDMALDMVHQLEATGKEDTSCLEVEASSLNNLAYISNLQDDHQGSRAYLEGALEIYRRIGDRRGESVTLQNLGVVSYDQGDFVGAREYWGNALKIFQEIGDRQHEAMVTTSLGNIATDLIGDYATAQRSFEQALAIAQDVGDRVTESMSFGNMAIVAKIQGDFNLAHEHAQQALQIYNEIDFRPPLSFTYLIIAEALTGLERLDQAGVAYQHAIRCAEELDQHDEILEARTGLAWLSHLRSETDQALAEVRTILHEIGVDPAVRKLEPEASLRIYLACYKLLRDHADPQASDVLQSAYELLMVHAARIPDEDTRQLFLENIPWHRGIMEEYERI